MLDHGADPNPIVSVDKSPLNNAAAHASINTVKLLLERGADPSKSISLRYAIRRDEDWKAVVELLLDHGCDINAFHPHGFSGLRALTLVLYCTLLLLRISMIGFLFLLTRVLIYIGGPRMDLRLLSLP